MSGVAHLIRERAKEIARWATLEFGIVGVNDMVPATAEAPFGGMKESGIGREGGAEGIKPYLETRYISVALSGL